MDSDVSNRWATPTRRVSIALGALALLALAVSPTIGSRDGASDESTVAAGAPAGPTVAPLSRLRAVTPAGQQRGHLVDTATDEPFMPRGANWVRVTEVAAGPDTHHYHSTFEPGRYTTAEAENVVSSLGRDGYNAVRVFIDQGNPTHADTYGHPHGLSRGMSQEEALYGPYMDNVADFVSRATNHGVRVMFSLDHVPYNPHYLSLIGHVDREADNIDGRNLEYLHPSYVRAKEAYMADFVRELGDRIGQDYLSTVLAFQSDNEAYVVANRAPYNRMSGQVTTLNGLTYDMSDPTERQQSADANFVEYANRIAAAVKSVDPQGLVTIGMFTFGAVGRPGPQGMPAYCLDCDGEYRYPARPRSLAYWSDLDFLDIHIYPAHKPGINDPYTLDRNLQTIEWDQVEGMPVIIGEFGAEKQFYGQSITAAAHGMRDMQVDTCQRAMSGWLFWTFNVGDTPSLQRFYSLIDQQGAINGQLAPVVRPDPCSR